MLRQFDKTDIEMLMDALFPYTKKSCLESHTVSQLYVYLRKIVHAMTADPKYTYVTLGEGKVAWMKTFFVSKLQTEYTDKRWHTVTVLEIAELLLDERL